MTFNLKIISWLALFWHLLSPTGEWLALAQADNPVSLQVTAPRTTLREGETVQLKVIVTFPDGSAKDVTSTMTGTKYLTTSLGRQLNVDPNGLVTALSTEGWIERSDSVYVFYQSLKEVIRFTLVKRDAFDVTASKTTLRVGETVQLKVIQNLPDGVQRDLTDPSTGTKYSTTSEAMLIPESDGRVTCVGTNEKPRESAIVGIRNGKLRGSISFDLLPAGPGPGLEVLADKVVLYEGGQTQLKVYKASREDGRKDITTASSGMAYLIFTGYGVQDPSVIQISDTGLVTVTDSIGDYTKRTVIVFVRNGDEVGWIELTILPVRGRK